MKYAEYGAKIDELLEKRRKVSSGISGLSPARGHEEEYEQLTLEIDQMRKILRRLRYGVEE